MGEPHSGLVDWTEDAPPEPQTGGKPDPTPPEFPPATQALLDELRALERFYPLPAREDTSADFRWLGEVYGTPEFDPYRGKYVAVADQGVRGTGDSHLAAKIDAAKAYRRHPSRFFVSWVEPDEDRGLYGDGR